MDNSGVRGVVKVDRYDKKVISLAFDHAKKENNSADYICVEEYIEGKEYGGDCFISGGRISFIAVTQKKKDRFLLKGHVLQELAIPEMKKSIIRELERTCHSLGYHNGPLNFDIIMKQGRLPYILEMSPRYGGNGIPYAIARATGIDVLRNLINYSLGKRQSLPRDHRLKTPCGTLVFGSPKNGRLKALTPPEEMIKKVPEIFNITYVKRPGDRVNEFKSAFDLIGIVCFELAERDYDSVASEIERCLRVGLK